MSFGAWKNLWELENEITLAELFEFYQSAMEREVRFHKVVAAATGADVSGIDSGGDYTESGVPLSSDAVKKAKKTSGEDLPPGIGYEKI